MNAFINIEWRVKRVYEGIHVKYEIKNIENNGEF